jgi:hypothetical protein
MALIAPVIQTGAAAEEVTVTGLVIEVTVQPLLWETVTTPVIDADTTLSTSTTPVIGNGVEDVTSNGFSA